MPTMVEIPGVGNVEFPDSMNHDAIAAAAAKLYSGTSGPKPKTLDERQGTSARGYRTPTDNSWGGKFAEGAARGTLMPLGPPLDGFEDAITRFKNIPGALWGTVTNALAGDPETLGSLVSGLPYALGSPGGAAAREAAQTAKTAVKSTVKNTAARVRPAAGTGTILAGGAETAAGAASMAHGVSNLNPVSMLIGAKATYDGVKRVMTGLEKRRAAISQKLDAAHVQVKPVEVASVEASPVVAPAIQEATTPIVDIVAQKRAEAVRPTVAPEVPPVPVFAPEPRWDPSTQAPDPFKQTPEFQRGLEAMKARRRGAPDPAAPPAEISVPSDVEAVPLAPTPRSRGELAPGTGQQTLGFDPKSFAAGARDAKMMDLADAAQAAGIGTKEIAAMTKEQKAMLANLATAMKIQLVAEEKGITLEAAKPLVKPVKSFSNDTTGVLIKELGRREAMLKK